MSSWLDSVPVSDSAYAFQGALYCDDCGREMVEKLRDGNAEDDGDSNNFAQGPYPDGGGEADSAQFCCEGKSCVNAVSVAGRKVGCPIGNPLTSDGVRAVTESVVTGMFSRTKYSNMVSRLTRRVWADSLGDARPARVGPRYASDLPDTLARACKVHHAQNHLRDLSREGFSDAICADLDHAYLLYRHDDVVDLCRSAVDDEGKFQALEVASVPLQVAEGRDPGELLAEAVDEGAWD